MVCSHRRSAEEGTSAPLLPWDGWGVWNEPQHPQILLHLHCGEHPDRLHQISSHRWFGNSTAGNRKALQRVVRTARHIVGGEASLPPGHLQPGGCIRKPGGSSRTPAIHPNCSLCCPQGDVSAASESRTSRLRDSFFPSGYQANEQSELIHPPTITLAHSHIMPCTAL